MRLHCRRGEVVMDAATMHRVFVAANSMNERNMHVCRCVISKVTLRNPTRQQMLQSYRDMMS